ncbi:MAG: MFS transporter [Gammaproteobacteria bacterium]
MFKELHSTTRRLLASRFMRSLGQGALVVDLALYLHALGWSGARIGLVLTGGGAMAGVLSLVVGWTSDRLRRRPFLIYNELLTMACGLAAMSSTNPWLLSASIVLAGFGRGPNGSAGPFAPAEQAWLAEAVAPERRGRVYSLNTALGFAGMGIGALLAFVPGLFIARFGAAAYRPLFLLVVAGAVANMILLMGGRESETFLKRRRARPAGAAHRLPERRQENSVLRKLVGMNAINGLSIGMVGPLITYWMAIRFQVGPAEVAPVMAASFLLTGVSSLAAGRLTEIAGTVASVVWTRGIGVLLLAILPLMPFFWLAALVYLLRLTFSGASLGARQAQVISLVEDERRGLATSLNAASFQLPQSVGPSVAGSLIGAGFLVAPFYAGALLQGAYVLAYARVFGAVERRQACQREQAWRTESTGREVDDRG